MYTLLWYLLSKIQNKTLKYKLKFNLDNPNNSLHEVCTLMQNSNLFLESEGERSYKSWTVNPLLYISSNFQQFAMLATFW